MTRALCLALLLMACAEPGPPAGPARTPLPVANRLTPPPTTFDGRYGGTLTLNPDRSRTCPKLDAQERLLTVQGGRGNLEIQPATRQVLTGTVDQDGSLRLVDRIDRTIATEGVFTDGTFLGAHRNGLCSYAMRLRKRD